MKKIILILLMIFAVVEIRGQATKKNLWYNNGSVALSPDNNYLTFPAKLSESVSPGFYRNKFSMRFPTADGADYRIIMSETIGDSAEMIGGAPLATFTTGWNIDSTHLGNQVNANFGSWRDRWEMPFFPPTDTATHQMERWWGLKARHNGGEYRFNQWNWDYVAGRMTMRLDWGIGSAAGETRSSYMSGEEDGTVKFYTRGVKWLEAALSGDTTIVNLSYGAGTNASYTNRVYTDAYFLQGGTAMNIFPGGLTLGTASGTGTKPLYVDSLYQGSTLVLDASRNLKNIGTINTSGIVQIGTGVSANYGLSVGVSGKNGLYIESAAALYATGTITTETTVTAAQFKLSVLNTAPANAGATGTLGEIRIVDGYIYVCTATNTWKRAEIATW